MLRKLRVIALFLMIGSAGYISIAQRSPSGSDAPIVSLTPLDDRYEIITPENATFVAEVHKIETAERLYAEIQFSGFGLAYSPDSRRIAAGLPGANIGLWDVETGTLLRTFAFNEDPDWPADDVSRLEFSVDGQWLVGASRWTHQIAIWDVESGRMIHEFKKVNDYANIFALSKSDQIAVPTYDNGRDEIQIWDLRTLSLVRSIDEIGSLLYLDSGQSLMVGGHLYDIVTGEKIYDFGSSQRAIMSNDAGKLITMPDSNTLSVWNLDTRALVWTENISHIFDSGFIYSPDGSTLVIPHIARPGFSLWDGSTGVSIHEENEYTHSFIGYSPDGRLIVMGHYEENGLDFWNNKGQLLAAYDKTGYIERMTFSPNGRMLAVTTWEGFLSLFAVVRS